MPGFMPIFPETRAPVLVGRDDELAAAITTLRSPTTRLLTITGPGGVGKTRFGIELGRAIVDDFAGDAIIIDLTTIAEPEDLDTEIARVVGLRNLRAPEQLDTWMAGHRVLLVLDNAEQVLGIGPRLAHWLTLSPGSRAIVTSRHRLNISLETEIELGTLDCAPTSRGPSPIRSPAARLFLQVAGVTPDDDVAPEILEQVERICTRLDGLPLALELVGARLPVLTTRGLDTVLDLQSDPGVEPVVEGMDPALVRTVDASYRLLAPATRQVLRYSTVFVGGFSLELVERQVAQAERIDLGDSTVADCLEELSDHHLILPVEESRIAPPRFRMLNIVSETARRRLIEHDEETDAREAHARAVIAFAEQREHSGLRPTFEHQVLELAENFHNIVTALTWFDDRDDAPALVRLNGALGWFWYAHGYYGDGQAWFERTLEHRVSRTGTDWARFLLGYGILLDIQGHFAEAHAVLEEALARYVTEQHPFGITATSLVLGFCSFHLERHVEAERHLHRAIEHARNIPQPDLAQTMEGLAWDNIGANAHEQGALSEAEDAARHAVSVLRRVGFRWGESRALCDLAGILRDRRDTSAALEAYQRSITLAAALGDYRLIAASLAGIASVLTMDGQPLQVAWLWGAVDALRPMAGTPSYLRANLNAYARAQHVARDQAGARSYDEAYRIGFGSPLSEALTLANEVTLRGGPLLRVPPEISQVLTEREREVLELLVRGASTRSIGTVLGITDRTVSSHIGSLFRKLGTNSRLELIAMVVQAQ